MALIFKIDGKQFNWDKKLMFSEAKLIQRTLGCTVTEWEERANAGDIEAFGMVLFLAERRAGSQTEWADFEFDIAGLETIDTDAPANGPEPKARKKS